jgi:uncharacterized protein (TIRG00374 family)
MQFPVLAILIVAVASCAATMLLVALIRRWASAVGVFDLPEPRRLHGLPTPRGGGLAVVVVVCGGLVGAWPLLSASEQIATVAMGGGGMAVAAVSWLDDVSALGAASVRIRLLTQVLSAFATIAFVGVPRAVTIPAVGDVSLGPVTALLALLWVVWFTNAFNFMDGIDGIAGGQALAAGLGWVLTGWWENSALAMVTGALLCGASSGFLFHNWAPARIFMGDVGSTFLGFTLAVLPIAVARAADQPRVWPAGVLFLWPFVFDTGFTLVRRLVLRQNIFQPHRTHLYQTLVASGVSHSTVAGAYSALALVGTLAGLGLLTPQPWLRGWGPAVPILAAALWATTRARQHLTRPPWAAEVEPTGDHVESSRDWRAQPAVTRASAWLGAVTGLAGLWLAVRGLAVGDVFVRLGTLWWPAVVAALVLTLGNLVVGVWRWRLLFGRHPDRPGFTPLLRAIVIGQMVNILSPVRLGEVARAYALGERLPIERGRILGTVAIERTLDVLVSWIALAALVFAWPSSAGVRLGPAVALLVTAAGAVGGVALVRRVARASGPRGQQAYSSAGRRLHEAAQRIDEASMVLQRPAAFLASLGMSVTMLVSGAAANAVLATALQLPMTLPEAVVLLLTLQFAAVLPSLPARIGVFHYVTVTVLETFGIGRAEALSYAVVLYCVALLPKLAIGLMWLSPGRGAKLT